MLSYHADMDAQTSPFELGLDRLVDLEMPTNFIGKAALKRVQQQGITRQQVGLEITGEPLPGPNTQFWPAELNGEVIGRVTSAVYSPRLKKNIPLAMLPSAHSAIGTTYDIQLAGETRNAAVVPKPFHDPKKQITKGSTITRA